MHPLSFIRSVGSSNRSCTSSLPAALFDRTGSYNLVLFAFLVATLVAAILIQMLGPYRYRPH